MIVNDASIETVNPATGQRIQRYDDMTLHDAVEIIAATHQAFLIWRDFSFIERSASMRKLAQLLRERKNDYALLIANEMGKPLAQGVAEIEKCAVLCLHYADAAEENLAARPVKTNMKKSYVTYEPLGIVFGIMPWNFPFWQVFRFAVPALMAGNAALLKHAPISTGTALEIEKLFHDAGFVPNIFRTLIISNEVAAEVIAHPEVAAVSFTGSVSAGKIIATAAAKSLKKNGAGIRW